MLRIIISIIFIAFPLHAFAELQICNYLGKIAFASVMYNKGDNWFTKGKVTLHKGSCTTVDNAIRANYYINVLLYKELKYKSYKGCIQKGDYVLSLNDQCKGEDKWRADFMEIPSKGRVTYFKLGAEFNDYVETKSTAHANINIKKACDILYQKLDKPRLRSEQIVLAHYTDLFTLPQTRTECTNIYDTGVPDLKTCTTDYNDCASKWEGPLGSWGCIPGTTTHCTNIKACNAWKTEKKTMECNLVFQLKLPNFIEQPISNFIDESYAVIESSRRQLGASLPSECVPDEYKPAMAQGKHLENLIKEKITSAIRKKIEDEAKRWIAETGVKTIVASIPSGGLTGAAALASSVGEFIYRVHRAVEPILSFANDVKGFAEDVGFSTSCGWSDWSRL